jgi:preprotein translocase subunit YajC
MEDGLGQLLPSIFILMLFVVMFYFFFIKPQRQRQKKHQELINSLRRGDKVVTAGGICGVVKKVDQDRVLLEVSEGVTLRVLKGSIVERE